VAIGPRAPEGLCVVTVAERQAADLLPIEIEDIAVALWFYSCWS
jgi:hypothetical protein